jgi:hypothetical protein
MPTPSKLLCCKVYRGLFGASENRGSKIRWSWVEPCHAGRSTDGSPNGLRLRSVSELTRVIDSIICVVSKSVGDSVRIQKQSESFASRLGADTVTSAWRSGQSCQAPANSWFVPRWSTLVTGSEVRPAHDDDDVPPLQVVPQYRRDDGFTTNRSQR